MTISPLISYLIIPAASLDLKIPVACSNSFILGPKLEEAGVKTGRDRFFEALGKKGLLLERLPGVPRTTDSRHSLSVFHNLVKEMELAFLTRHGRRTLRISAPARAFCISACRWTCGPGK
jgi:hypothetical protein